MTTQVAPSAAEQLRMLFRSLETQHGFVETVAALREGRAASFDGAWGSSCALLAAALERYATGPLVVVCPQVADVDEFCEDLSLFSGARPLKFPAWEEAPGEQLVQDDIYGERLRTLKRLEKGSGAGESARDGGPSADASQPARRGPLAKRKPRTGPGLGGFSDDPSAPTRPPAQPSTLNLQPSTLNLQPSTLIVTSIQSLLQAVPSRAVMAENTRELRVGERLDVDRLLKWLAGQRFHATSAVELPGEFSQRGGIIDLFAPDWDQPVRVELFDDEIESIRRFDVASQRSLESLPVVEITVLGNVGGAEAREGEAREGEAPAEPCSVDVHGSVQRGSAGASPSRLSSAGALLSHFSDYLPPNAWVLLVEPRRVQEAGEQFLERVERKGEFHSVADVLREMNRFAVATAAALSEGLEDAACHLRMESVERFSGDFERVRGEFDRVGEGHEVFVVARTEAEIKRLGEIFSTTQVATAGRLHFVPGSLRTGFRLVHERIVVITGAELFHRDEVRRVARRHLGKAIDSFLDLNEGDLVVHLSHGIGRYRGLRLLEKQEHTLEHLVIEFAEGTKILVPAAKIDLVQRYVGGTKSRPKLAKIGGQLWVRHKKAAETAVVDMAAELLDLQAARQTRPGIAFSPDSDWQQAFDASFPYRETPDQLTALEAIKADMLRSRPMDRLLCGDVGFGKTEVAMRAVFKAVDSGYQVAVLVPTTILAEQHYHTFQERMAEFPFDIARLSRFCPPPEEREIIRGLKSGRIDIVIGTHRLASSDVEFHNLGLVIIDEEQRFGVEVKEKLKTLRTTVDVLTMTATPIPRTLHMSLVGVRDISNLETPPDDRVAVETTVTKFNNELIRHAVLRELNRDGQIFFVHNRVEDIEVLAQKLKYIVPEASVRIGHGQMPEHELEEVMAGFIAHRFDLLLATTIVESGLDIPNANTIFIDEADRYGLADLHQLRGRVGRYKHRAHCYLLIDPLKYVTPNAAKRLRAIEEYSELGAGFAVAMRDLEIRGAGNLLGSQQSGHIAAIGYELYCQLLENAVRSLRKLPPKLSLDVDIDLPGQAYIPTDYIPDIRQKIDVYRRIARIAAVSEIADMRTELVDRFGKIPEPVRRMLSLAELKIDAAVWQIGTIRLEEQYMVFDYTQRGRIEQLATLNRGKMRVVDGKSAYLTLPGRGATPDQLINLAKSVLRPK